MNDTEKKVQQVLDDDNMKLGYDLSFPIYKILPDEVQLALKVLARHEMKVIIIVKPKSQDQ